MTKREVSVGFCRAIALVGMSQAAFGLVRMLVLRYGVHSHSVRVHSFAFWEPVLPLGMFLFVWFLARGIGAELLAPREVEETVDSSAALSGVLLRGVGLWLFLAAAPQFGWTILSWGYEHFINPPPPSMAFPAPIDESRLANLIVGFAASLVGFGLAFTPRIRAFFRS